MTQQPSLPKTATGPPEGSRRTRRRRLWWLVSVVLIAAAVAVGISRRRELVDASHLIARVSLPILAVAVVCEAASVLCFAVLQLWLLRAGGKRLRPGEVAAIVTAANAIAGLLPGGVAFSVAWVYRQYSRRGVQQVLAATVLVVSGALSILSLFLLLVVGVLVSGSSGPGGSLTPAVIVLAAMLLVAIGLTRSTALQRAARRRWQRLGARSARIRSGQDALARLVTDARSVQPGVRPWLRPLGLALLNWVLDALCLASCLWALGIGIPWRGFLVIYGLTQISGSLRLTPGSLGIIEASLAALLVLYGLRADQAIAATLLYRIVSYWALQPVGWASWLGLTLRARLPGGRNGSSENGSSEAA